MGNVFGYWTTEPINQGQIPAQIPAQKQQQKQTKTQAQVAKPKSPMCLPAINSLIEEENRSHTNSKIDIEKDCNDVRTAVLSARDGEWQHVWNILGSPDKPHKEYLINCIPETRRWGILHQAVYWRDKNVITRLLKFKGCDVDLKAKVGMSEIGDACGKTALEIATGFGFDDIQDILRSKHTNGDDELSTFVLSNDDMLGYEHPLLKITLALYRDAFLSASKEIKRDQSFHGLLFDIFVELETSTERWRKVHAIICDSLKPVSYDSANTIGRASTKAEFYAAIINAYTIEDSWLYAYINRALRRQSVQHYTPPANDLACGPYILMFYILMMFWNGMVQEFQTTYRRMNISKSDFQMYKPGTKFIWTAFTSSSVYEEYARSFPSCPADLGGWNKEDYVGVVFTVDNSRNTAWNPRNIAPFAEFNESERTYPPGAMFAVTNIQEEKAQEREYKVTLTLLDSLHSFYY